MLRAEDFLFYESFRVILGFLLKPRMLFLGRRRAAAQKKMLQNMVRSTLLFFPHVWRPFGLESQVLRVHGYLHVKLQFLIHLCNRKSQKCELPILVCSLSLSELMSNLKKAMKAIRT